MAAEYLHICSLQSTFNHSQVCDLQPSLFGVLRMYVGSSSVYTGARAYAHDCTYTYVRTYIHVRTYVYTYICAYVYVCTTMYIRTYV